ncbi:FHA domain-containing protein [Caballeronia humi]|jgi:pSer/pThr/pTyr-binding forkhead associated (FHA) protein|uniref:FHA domain protein n=1 Tax=Caballeronia humi TaxID=326474 RepID=A0A158G708_9BURK|nr:FHA domain-containing protein [Caballeronia humi]SAL27894.1 FHA domain protein [Caballeronia humi]
MSDKTIKSVIGRLWGGARPATGYGKTETTCPKGHPMDPSWTECPVCRAESQSRDKSSPDAVAPNVSRNPTMSRNATVTPGSSPNRDSGATRIDPGDERSAPSRSHQPVARRKITGAIATFTWERQGELFVLYEGRNVIGKGEVASEGGRPCDVLLQSDPTMSNEHATILCRQGRYELFDLRSTNGTFVDGEFVETTGVDLKDGAKIKTGDTVWVFRKIIADEGGAHVTHTRRDDPDDPDEPDDPPPRDRSRVL